MIRRSGGALRYSTAGAWCGYCDPEDGTAHPECPAHGRRCHECGALESVEAHGGGCSEAEPDEAAE